MDEVTPWTDIPADDDPRRLAAAFGYLATPVVPIVNMTGAGPRDSWMRYHSLQALFWSGPFILLLVASIVGLFILVKGNFLFICLMPLIFMAPFVPGAYWARRIYIGEEVAIPIIASRAMRSSNNAD